MASIGNLFSKSIFVRLTNSKSEDRFKSIHITVDYQTNTLPTHKTELIIKLTDEQDPFFLYSLYMSEEDYQTLKVQQGLLVDFSAFGQRFIDLLCACEKDEKVDNPKFQLQFYSKEPLPFDHGHASLNIIEINPFKHLCHLSLNFMPGNDADVKKYLAMCLQTLREDHAKLVRIHEDTSNSLTQKLDATQQALMQKNSEIERLRADLETQAERLATKHMQEINFERDKSLQSQFAAQQKYDKERKELEVGFGKSTRQLEARVNDLEQQNKDLLEKKYKLESQLQEQRLKATSVQEEAVATRAELMATRKQNTALDTELHASEKQLNQLRTRVAVLESELKDKVDANAKLHDTLGGEQQQHKQLDDLLKEKTSELKKKQAEINHYVQEFKKGNDVVIKLQGREKTLAGQIKLKTRILTEQEKVMKEKEKEIDDFKAELKELRAKLNDMSEQSNDLKNSLQKKTAELDEAAKLLKRDENIISWLNKQINDNKIASGGDSRPVSYDPGSSVAFRPVGTLLSNPKNMLGSSCMSPSCLPGSDGFGSQMGHIDSAMSNLMRINPSNGNSSGSVNGNYSTKTSAAASSDFSRSSSNTQSSNGGGGGTAASTQLQLYSNLNGYQQRMAGSLSSTASSLQQHQHRLDTGNSSKDHQEIDSPSLSHRQMNGSSDNATTISSSSTSNDSNGGRLDPKYFQSNSHSPLQASALNVDVVPIKQKQQQQLQLGSKLTAPVNSVRISKHLVQQGAYGVSSSAASSSASQTQQTQQQPPPPPSISNQYGAVISSKSTPTLASAYFPSHS